MSKLKDDIKKYLLKKHAQAKLKECNRHITKNIPWILRKSFMNNIETYCNVLLNSLLSDKNPQKLRENKYIMDTLLKYNLERSEIYLKSNKKIKNMKDFMQLNSYIVYEEVTKGLTNRINKQSIDYNIRAHLLRVQEKIKTNSNIEQVLKEEIEKIEGIEKANILSAI